MNSIANIKSKLHRVAQWPLFCGLLGLMLARTASGADALYLNTVTVNNYPNLIDATNFANGTATDPSAAFIYNFTTPGATGDPELYYTLDTLNYTNYGTISGNNGFDFETISSQSGLSSMASSFYNSGLIDCGSSANLFPPVNWNGLPEFVVSATNVMMINGAVDVGLGGLLQITGRDVNLNGSVFSMEGGGSIASVLGAFGTDTNEDWDPSIALGPTHAFASLPYPIFLPFSTPYFDFQNQPSNTVIRTVFIEDTSTNVTYNVDFNSPADLGGGTTTIQWAGAYVDPATGNMFTNYLYLKNDYLLGANALKTKVQLVNGIPSNFTFTESTTPLLLPPFATPGFSNVFFPGVLTNRYSYVEAQPIPTTESTIGVALTNLTGRLQITASRELNLNLAEFAGQNYMSLTSTNQYDGNNGASIISPFIDLNLGATNGQLTISNLVPQIPVWSGTIQAWSTRWFIVDTNGVTNDFRVMIVSSQLSPTSPAQVQNLRLHATNNVVISDTLNIMNSLFIDAQNLTLTANGLFNGSVSPDGELNLESNTVVWNSSLPNLRNLTNNGAIRDLNSENFGGAAPANYHSFINNGLLSDQGSQIWADHFVSGGMLLNGSHSFTLQSLNTMLTNGSIIAGGVVSITTSNLVASNVTVSAGQSLVLAVTNCLTDTGVTNGNIWTVGGNFVGAAGIGLSLPIKPLTGDLLGTTITNVAPDNKRANIIWAGNDVGYSTTGFSNNAGVGRFILDAAVTNVTHMPPNTQFTFTGTGASNAIYVDYLELRDYATNRTNGNLPALSFNPSLVIYYAQAVANGVSVAEKINGANTNHLRWIPTYTGFFSSTNLIYTNVFNGMTNITTNTFNAALAQSTTYDSDGDGIVNANDSTPFYVAGEMNFRLTVTNLPPLTALISWQTIPGATNYLSYRTNLVTGTMFSLTNFITPTPKGTGLTNVTVSDPVNLTVPKFYQLHVNPNMTPPPGP